MYPASPSSEYDIEGFCNKSGRKFVALRDCEGCLNGSDV